MPAAIDAVDTHCPYCALQCAMSLTPSVEPVVEVRGRDFPTNRGGLCHKGWTSARVLDAPARLREPLVRRSDGELAPATWDEALDVVVTGLRRVQQDHGPEAVALFGGGHRDGLDALRPSA